MVKKKTLDVRASRLGASKEKENSFSFSRGNTKLGRIPNFSLPNHQSESGFVVCPDSTTLCRAACYPRKWATFRPSVPRAYEKNLSLVRENLDRGSLVKTLGVGVFKATGGSGFFRIHVSGDFFSLEYFEAWIEVIRSLPTVTFLAYTRSFSVLLAYREKHGALDLPTNFRLFLSVDRENFEAGYALFVRFGLPLAMMGGGEKKADGFVTCPEATGARASCLECGLCFSDRAFRASFGVFFPLH